MADATKPERDYLYDDPRMPEILEEIWRRMSLGESLLSICADEEDFGAPSAPTIRRWVIADTPRGIAAQYARARELQYDSWADQITDAADKPLIGVRTKETVEHGLETTTGDNVDRSRLMVDARKWILSKLAPKKYGDRLQADVTHGVSDPLAQLMREIRGSSQKNVE